MCLLLIAICLFLFKEVILGGDLLLGDDFIAFYLGMKGFLYEELQIHGSIPFWNPYIFGGMPFWAHFESTIFYPLDFLFWFISPEKAYGYTMFIHIGLAGVFMYLLAKSFGISRSGSFLAASIFMGNGFIMALLYLGHMCPVQSYIWLPLVIYFVNRATKSKTPCFHAILAGTIWGIQILAGAPQDAYYTFFASILFLGCVSIGNHGAGGALSRSLRVGLLLFLVGTGIAAIQIIPAMELVNESVRSSLDNYEMVTQASYPLEGIITTVMPHFFGNYTQGDYWVNNVPWSIPQQSLYVGLLPLILLPFLTFKRSNSKAIILFAVILAIIAILLAFGKHTPLYKFAYQVPGFDRFRAPAKIIVLWVFALGLLAGNGMDHFLNCTRSSFLYRMVALTLVFISFVALDGLFHTNRSIILKFFSPFILDEAIPQKMLAAQNLILVQFHRFTLFGLFFLSFIAVMKSGLLNSKFVKVSLFALMLVDLGSSTMGSIRHNDNIYRAMEEMKRGVHRNLVGDNSLYRVGSFQNGFGPNFEMYLGLQTVGGYTALILSRYYDYINKYTENALPESWAYFFYGLSERRILMDMLNVKYHISHVDRKVAMRDTYLPRAFIVPSFKTLSKYEILNFLTNPEFDPAKVVLLETENSHPVSTQASHPIQESKSQVKIVSYRPDEIVIETESNDAGYLFLSEIFYPGWKAFVDDHPRRVFRGNYLFRIIEIPRGEHTVRILFDPVSIKIGIGLTILTLFMVIITFVHRYGKGFHFLRQR